MASIVKIAPLDAAARIKPRPSEPTFKISLANTGSKATAPPKNTENKSKAIAANIILFVNTKFKPTETLLKILSFGI
ncbi:hypothetical protein D3C85_1328380 [compost metagenome]